MSDQGEVWRRVRTTFKENMSPEAHSSTSPADCKIRALAIWPARAVVPVIFIPGIMGSNLRNTKLGKDAWVPPNGTGEGISEYKRRRQQIAANRQIQLRNR